MLTFFEQRTYNLMKARNPNIQLLEDHLGLDPNGRDSDAYIKSRDIQTRINLLVDRLANAPHVPQDRRSWYVEPPIPQCFRTPAQIKEFIIKTNFKL